MQDNCVIEKCCWVAISIVPKADILLYLDVVEEALCFGWIDGVKKKNLENQLIQRLSPRNKKSSWTELNKERVRRLEKLGLMTDAIIFGGIIGVGLLASKTVNTEINPNIPRPILYGVISGSYFVLAGLIISLILVTMK